MRRADSLGFVVAAVTVLVVTSSCAGSSKSADPGPTKVSTSQTDPTSPAESTATADPEPHFSGAFDVVKTALKVPSWATDAKVGDKFPRTWVVKADCAEGSCDGRVISSSPTDKGRTSYDFVWSSSGITFGSTTTKTSCGKGFGTYQRVTTYNVRPSSVAADGTVTALTGTSTEVIKRDSPGSQCFQGFVRLGISAKAS
jgi:hypothetical protein